MREGSKVAGRITRRVVVIMKVVEAVAVLVALLAYSQTAEGVSKGPKVTHKVRIIPLFL